MATIRQNYLEASEAGVNKQINLELYASYTYLSMVSVFSPVFLFRPHSIYVNFSLFRVYF